MPEKGTNKGEIPPEVDKYLAALLKDPKSKAFVPLADTYRKAGMIDEAIQVAKDGLKYNSNYVSGRLVLGRCYFDKEMLKEAEDELTKVVKINPENADAQKILAKIKEKTGRFEEAIKIWDIVLTLSPADSEARQKIEEFKKTIKVEEEKEPQPAVQPEKKEEEIEAKVEEKVEVEKEKAKEVSPTSACEISVKETEKAPDVIPEIAKAEVCEIPITKTEEQSVASADVEEPAQELGTEQKVKQVEMPQSDLVRAIEEKTEKIEGIKTKEEGEGISTRALAELYIKQGFLERALKVYKELEVSSPEDKEIKEQINFINTELNKKKEKEPKETKFKENIKTLSSWLDKIKRGG